MDPMLPCENIELTMADDPQENGAKPPPYRFRLCFLPRTGFPVRKEEQLYLSYTENLRQRAIPRLLAIGFLLQLFTIFVPGEKDLDTAYTITSIGLAANVTLSVLYYYIPSRRFIISHVSWFALWIQLLATATRRQGDAYNELLAWAALLQYFTIAALPFRIITLICYSILSFSAYLAGQFWNAFTHRKGLPKDFLLQEIGSGSILLCTSLMGATSFIVYENQQRRSFMETKRSLRDKLTIDQQSKEQERLLLSVLPEHVAVEMRRDLGLIDTQFKKIYMSRHENVSILYADIVGFTAISSTYSAQDLVAILNELFARFDRLAEKYQQLRIKILGDCYYCISGAPVEYADHAVLCVHMGLSMVKAIKYVQQTTNSPVDMRVGIHTGAVLAGVLGQRQWQFDVYSRDVELANKMESSGMAGRVHISEVTLGFLKNHFEVEPAYGEKREEMLRQAGIKTYFITKVLIPFYGDEKGADADKGDTLSDLRDDDEDSVLSPEGETESEECVFHKMLVRELSSRDDDKELAGTGLCLRFGAKTERAYLQRADPPPFLVLAVPLCLLVPILTVGSIASERSIGALVSFLFMTAIAVAVYVLLRKVWRKRNQNYRPELGLFYITCIVGAYCLSCVFPLILCEKLHDAIRAGLAPRSNLMSGDNWCLHPSYFYEMCICGMLYVLMISPATCAFRFCLLFGVYTSYIFRYIESASRLVTPTTPEYRLKVKNTTQYIRNITYNGTTNYSPEFLDVLVEFHFLRHFLMASFMMFAVSMIDRFQFSPLDRARFLRGQRMKRQAAQAVDLRRRNQALVHNVLPPHVACHFMGAHRHHRDLYSQSYAEVGVLFASMPNFTEFYSEETVNNQGLECLRFLNEVISDFDLLLEDPKFRDITKIKTISSTYMAASGLNPKREMKESDGTVVRWEHLMCLVEFALELQRVLAGINEQSFNHFVLRMGVNHGPITAGVIGARKPHYDIWGNTVNVASRMESTGKAGCIQVTEETCHILEDFGYYFEQRGLVAVKGKGQLMTYYLQGRGGSTPKAAVPKVVEPIPQVESGPEESLLPNDAAAATLTAEPDVADKETDIDHPLLPGN